MQKPCVIDWMQYVFVLSIHLYILEIKILKKENLKKKRKRKRKRELILQEEEVEVEVVKEVKAEDWNRKQGKKSRINRTKQKARRKKT